MPEAVGGAALRGPCPKCRGEHVSLRVGPAADVIHLTYNSTCSKWADLYNYIRAIKASPQAYLLPRVLRQLPQTTCQGCGAAITFVQTHRGRLLPLDAAGDTCGDAHWAICPEAARFRPPART